MNTLILNCGSSSIKFAIIELANQKRLLNGQIEKIGTKNTFIKIKNGEKKSNEELGQLDQSESLNYLLGNVLKKISKTVKIDAIGHRVVHGGNKFTSSVRIDKKVMDAVKECNSLAPLHNPANLLGIELSMEAFGDLPQVAVFDTAFHQTMPEKAFRYAVPEEWYKDYGVRRYGFHGSSHRYVSQHYADVMELDLNKLQIITVHLGNGSSATAIKYGKSVDTTMGFTPLEGLVMGTRSGDIDPGLFSFLHEQKNLSLKDIHQALNKKSGLLGLSCLSSDMQELESKKEEKQIKIALEVMSYRLAKQIMSLTASLDSLDAIIFTGGIGENSSFTRKNCVEHLKVLGLCLDEKANLEHGQKNKGMISKKNTPMIAVIPTDEELMIAKDTAFLL